MILTIRNNDTGEEIVTDVSKNELFEAIFEVTGITVETLGSITKAELKDILEDTHDLVETQLFNNLKGGNA